MYKICLLIYFSLDANGTICQPSTILILWQNNCNVVKNLTQDQILDRINDPTALILYVYNIFFSVTVCCVFVNIVNTGERGFSKS